MLFSHRHVYKFRQRNLFFSEVPNVDLFDFGTKLFNYCFEVTYAGMLLRSDENKHNAHNYSYIESNTLLYECVSYVSGRIAL